MLIVGIVISVVLSAVVSIIIRQVDKNENQIEKVRNYADKRKKEFEEYFKSQKDSQNFLINELRTKEIETEAAITRMDQQIKDCKETTESFENPVQAVQNIEDRISSYDNILKNLMEMTAAVEQNLASIKNEAVLVDKVNARLNKQQKIAENLEGKVSDLIRQFSSKNGEQLRTIGEDLLRAFQERAEQFESTTERAKSQNEAIMQKIEDDIRNAYSAAMENAKKLEDESFSQLREESQSRIDGCRNEIDTQAKQITAMIDGRIGETKKLLDEKNSELSKAFKDYSSLMETKFSEKTENLQQFIDARSSHLSENWQQKISELEESLAEKTSGFESNLSEKVSSLVQTLDVKTGDVESSVSERLDKIAENVANVTGNLEKSLGEKINELSSRVNNASSTMENAVTEKIQIFTDRFSGQLEEIENKIEDESSSMSNTIYEKINDLKSDLDNNIYEAREHASSRIDELRNTIANSTETLILRAKRSDF